MDLHNERQKRIDMIAHAMKITPEARNAHPWLGPLWDEVQYLRQQLDNTPKQDEEIAKTATQILREKKEAAAKLSDEAVEEMLDTPKKPAAKRTRKAKSNEDSQG